MLDSGKDSIFPKAWLTDMCVSNPGAWVSAGLDPGRWQQFPAEWLNCAQALVLLNSAISLCLPVFRQVCLDDWCNVSVYFTMWCFSVFLLPCPLYFLVTSLFLFWNRGKQQEQGAESPVVTEMLILRGMSVSVGDAGTAIAAVILRFVACMGTTFCPWKNLGSANELINGSWLFLGMQAE